MSLTSSRPTPAESFAARVTPGGPDECWEWRGYRQPNGYGKVAIGHRGMGYAHRAAWELVNGPIPPGMVICHRCDNPPCCNPAHLFVGTYADNAQDRDRKGRGLRGRGLLLTVCRHGHEQNEETRNAQGCRVCRREYDHRRLPIQRARRALGYSS